MDNNFYKAIGLFSNLLGLEKGAYEGGIHPVFSTDIEEEIESVHTFLKTNSLEIFKLANVENLHFADKAREPDYDIQNILKNSGLQIERGDIDLIIGGPPCFGLTGLSNKRSVYNHHNYLMLEMIRLVGEIQPKVMLMEQVPLLLSKQAKLFYDLLVSRIIALGNYHYEFRKLNAKNYGCYQARERVILMLVRKDLGILPTFPVPRKVDLSKQSAYNVIGAELIRTRNRKDENGERTQRMVNGKTSLFPTLTSESAEVFRNNRWGKLTLADRKIVSHMEHFDMSPKFGENFISKRLGLMVLWPFAKALCEHVRTEILDKSPFCLHENNIEA